MFGLLSLCWHSSAYQALVTVLKCNSASVTFSVTCMTVQIHAMDSFSPGSYGVTPHHLYTYTLFALENVNIMPVPPLQQDPQPDFLFATLASAPLR